MRSAIVHQLQSQTFDFETLALDIYAYQSKHNVVYRQYLTLTGMLNRPVRTVDDIPFLPIQFFKSHPVKTGQWTPEASFTSSGTTGQQNSKHLVRDKQLYLQNATRVFESTYGSLDDYHILALLPGYIDRQGSSLIEMVHHFMQVAEANHHGFFLNQFEDLRTKLIQLRDSSKKTLLIGVSFALLDFAESEPDLDLSHVIVMETGGMKGRRKELIRSDLHRILQDSFHLDAIHSEYGMTELFSQAYSKGGGIFLPSQTLDIRIRELNDPFSLLPSGKSGLINIIDLANIDTCSFIATDDIGKRHSDGRFEILGRTDGSAIRGCNLMVE